MLKAFAASKKETEAESAHNRLDPTVELLLKTRWPTSDSARARSLLLVGLRLGSVVGWGSGAL